MYFCKPGIICDIIEGVNPPPRQIYASIAGREEISGRAMVPKGPQTNRTEKMEGLDFDSISLFNRQCSPINVVSAIYPSVHNYPQAILT